ncbi:hypothetical protein [Aestuariivirga litoralis]|uniref:hypothetical protein n=1 Tax=Aestuariivirga litoralis TaxID=2650924 RepID=UPI0011B5A358|nr:hypothetical protein [Aestuariivirga litoralis]
MLRTQALPEMSSFACCLGERMSANGKPWAIHRTNADCVFLAKAVWKCHKRRMCFHATISGVILPIWSKTAYDEVMLHCARIGFKP